MDAIKLDTIANIIQNVNIEPSVLFLTSEPTSGIAIKFCKLPWSCIYTTLKSKKAATPFETSTRRVVSVVSEGDSGTIRLNQREVSFVQLLGYEDDQIDPIEQLMTTQVLLESIPQILTTYGKLIIDCSALPDELKSPLLLQLSKLTRKNSVCFFGAASLKYDLYAQHLIKKGIAISFDENLWGILNALSDSEYGEEFDESIESSANEQSNFTFFVRKKQLSFTSPLEQELLLNVSRFATLLSYEEVELSDKFSDAETIQRFQLFLQSSSSGKPQWYGYRAEHTFHLQRYFEEELYQKTIEHLENAASRDRTKKPIVLRGQACSGKTNALSALAYRIFHERNYPVVYIHDPDVDLSVRDGEKYINSFTERTKSDSYVALENLLRQVEAKTGNPIPTLILWDTSCRLQSKIRAGFDLVKNLRSDGRLVQLICTSHEIIWNPPKNAKNSSQSSNYNPFSYYDVIDVKGKLMGAKKSQDEGDGYNEKEKVQQMLVQFGGFRSSDAERMMKYYGSSETFIASLYLFRELHRDLKVRLRRENEGRIDDIVEGIKEISKEELERKSKERLNTVIAQKLKKEMDRVGWKLSLPANNDEEENLEADHHDTIKKLVCCIALCTIYKERLPMSMAVRLLGTIDSASSKIFGLVANNSLLRSDIASDDEPVVSLRSELEAKLLLEAYGISLEGRVDLICQLVAVASAQENSKDIQLIQNIIQIVGPNNRDTSVSLWKEDFEGFELLVSALRDFRKNNNSTSLLLQELTLNRELCNHPRYPYSDEEKIQQLRDVQELANRIILEHPNNLVMTSFLANLYVEWANTTLRLSLTDATISKTDIYKQIASKMERVIRQFPKNGFAYSAYLWAGVNYAKTLPETDEKLELLQNLCNIADTIQSESNDINSDTNVFAELDNLIDSISFTEERFEKSIENGKSYGLYFKIRSLIGSGEDQIVFTEALPDKASVNKRCRQIIRLGENPIYKAIMEKDAACMYALINIKWLMYTRLPIIPEAEDVCIKLSQAQWLDIRRDCQIYLDELCRFRSPKMVFLQALSSGHLSEYRSECEGLFEELRKGTNVEIRSHYILCDYDGVPLKFDGQLSGKYNTYIDRGYININASGLERSIYFRAERIGRKGDSIRERELFTNLSIAVGYRGFQVCKL